MSQNREDMDTQMFLWVVLLLLILVAIPAMYAAKAGYINGLLLSVSKLQLKAFVPFSEEAQIAWTHISGLDPNTLTWERMQGVLTYTGKWVRWPFGLLLGMLGAAAIFMGRTRGLVRRLNMDSLLRNNAESFTCLRPVVGRGQYLLSPESYDSGLWRIARSPVQFALEHGLLIDEHGTPFSPEQALHNGLASVELPAYGRARLDEDKALAVLLAQLGPVFSGFEPLSPARRALAAAFISYAAGDKKECVSILDAVASSYTEKDGVAACPLLERGDFAGRLTKAWEQHQGILSEISLARHTSYELPWFMALLNRARQKGVLASSQFLWLRPLDRSLWYALNQCGGRAAWAEAFAVWAHYTAEEKAGRALHEPHVTPAVVSLRDSLFSQGWLADTARAFVAPNAEMKTAPVPVAGASAGGDPILAEDAGIESPPDTVYAEAEEDPEIYDANTDAQLGEEQY
ncbi:hypothetical protein LJC46_09690 [Desulfovibrio sp. OttesenSCG-928-G15]|nr:hypothetical protein [Desulfovibrio sp. OttesenSCG-928-G15]